MQKTDNINSKKDQLDRLLKQLNTLLDWYIISKYFKSEEKSDYNFNFDAIFYELSYTYLTQKECLDFFNFWQNNGILDKLLKAIKSNTWIYEPKYTNLEWLEDGEYRLALTKYLISYFNYWASNSSGFPIEYLEAFKFIIEKDKLQKDTEIKESVNNLLQSTDTEKPKILFEIVEIIG